MRKEIFRTADEYLALQPEKTRLKLEELRIYILKEVPEAEEKINYNIPAYSLIRGGKRDQQIMIAGYKTHVGFYPTPQVLDKFADELVSYKCGKGSVQFPLDEPLPEKLIRRMVCFLKQQIHAAHKL